MKRLVAVAAVLAAWMSTTAADCGHTTNYNINAPQTSTNGASPSPSACGLQATQVSVIPKGGQISISGAGSTLDLTVQVGAGDINIPNDPCLNSVPVDWSLDGSSPTGDCSLSGTQGSTSETITENATGTCQVCAHVFGLSGCANITLK